MVQDELQYPQTILVFYYGFGYRDFSMEKLKPKKYLNDQSVRNTNCPLSPLHHALHNQLHLQNISHSEANVYGKLILQHFVKVLSGHEVMV